MANNQYNEEPVYFCTRCLSLNIQQTPDGTDFCENCNSTDINQCNINHWEELYLLKYGHKYLNEKNHGREKNRN